MQKRDIIIRKFFKGSVFLNEILKLAPALKDYIWGGTELKKYFSSDSDKISEAWVLSCHKDGKSVVIGGKYDKMPLDEAISAMGRENALGNAGAAFEFFPILIKLINSAQNLSVQVHPNDEYAKIHEGEYGKTEMWYILDSKPGAGIYYGFKNEISKEEFETAVKNNTLTSLLNFTEVSPGECYFIPSGTIHAIGAGLTIAEIQQNSNTTYRVYDFGRVGRDGKPRELHISKALDVTKLCPAENYPSGSSENGVAVLSKCRYFTAEKIELDGEKELFCGDSFLSVLVTDGEGKIDGEAFTKFDSFFVPAQNRSVKLCGKGEIIVSRVEK